MKIEANDANVKKNDREPFGHIDLAAENMKLKKENEQMKAELCNLDGGLDWCCDKAWSDEEGQYVEDVASMLQFMKHRVKRIIGKLERR